MKKVRDDSRLASEQNFVSQKSMTFDLVVLLKENLVCGFDSRVKGSVMEFLAHKSLTWKNQEWEGRSESEKYGEPRNHVPDEAS